MKLQFLKEVLIRVEADILLSLEKGLMKQFRIEKKSLGEVAFQLTSWLSVLFCSNKVG